MRAGIYRHFKGRYYQVIGVAVHSETEERCVVYQALYGERQLFVRPLAMFAETVEREGEILPRFAYVGQDLPGDAEEK
ncbi:MAG TPA: DUF1653 domain-containing protein [Patescibacteria group bacterium]|nr:DUF1653 domain-containing protein [Patescibacteria group bacterium]